MCYRTRVKPGSFLAEAGWPDRSYRSLPCRAPRTTTESTTALVYTDLLEVEAYKRQKRLLVRYTLPVKESSD